MSKEDKIESLPQHVKLKIMRAKDFFPLISRGHGSQQHGKCNISGCMLDERHYQDRLEAAIRALGI